MGLPACLAVHARHRHGARRRDDPRAAAPGRVAHRARLRRGLIAALAALALAAGPAAAETLRIAAYHTEMSRKGPGLLLHELTTGRSPATEAAIAAIAATGADAILLLDVDFDPRLVTLAALADRLAGAGAPYPHRFALPPNRGVPTGLDLDGNGRTGEPGDAQGFGAYAGQGGMAILSRLPVAADEVRDWTGFLWADLPGAALPEGMTPEARAMQRLATTRFWEVPLVRPDGGRLRLLAFHAAPPAFDRRNRARNHDETAFWLRLLDGALPFAPPPPPFVILGNANADPLDGDGDKDAIRALLAHPALQDPAPLGTSGRSEPDHAGDTAQDTADFGRARGYPGALRVTYVLPSADLRVTAAGVLWPPGGDPLAETLATAGRHRPVWVELGRDQAGRRSARDAGTMRMGSPGPEMNER
ncbi:MAG: endonuclease/exonuclease/phosphatase family protein [Paracoccaceae bacterium]|nr:MAG: endonuclease/exonuclease/phosphatase family protein [Paracoccaceae bacterium]